MPDPSPFNRPTGAVFLSYAKQDASAAKRISDALTAAGLEVWFDQSELRGGDAWDQKIRRQIKECALFVPVISAHTQTRAEGYFRLEWHLAEQRTYLMAHDQAFLMPVVVDETSDTEARVPERFRERQWTRLPGGVTTPEFCERVRGLLSSVPAAPRKEAAGAPAESPQHTPTRKVEGGRWIVAAAAVVAAVAVAYWVRSHGVQAPAASAGRTQATAEAATGAIDQPKEGVGPNEKSVAVLPFANLSDDKDNEYFSEGISDELMTVLLRIPGLRVAARTSSFSFKGKNVTAQEIGSKLEVANLVEGSVQKSGNRVRVTARLSRVATGEELWSQSYTREVKDVFELQDELAESIVAELRGHLPGRQDDAAKQVRAAEKGGTRNAEAYQQYLQGRFFLAQDSQDKAAGAVEYFERATRLDPSFALAWSGQAKAHLWYCTWAGQISTAQVEDHFRKAKAALDRALELEPDLADALEVRVDILYNFEFAVKAAYDTAHRVLALDPGRILVLRDLAWIEMTYHRPEVALELVRRSVALDPVNPDAHQSLALVLLYTGKYAESRDEFTRAVELSPNVPIGRSGIGLSYFFEGRYAEAAAAAEAGTVEWSKLTALSAIYFKMNRTAEAQAALDLLIKDNADTAAYQVAEVYADRGDNGRSFEWLERAKRQHDPGLSGLTIDPMFKGMYTDPHWQPFLHSIGLAEDQL